MFLIKAGAFLPKSPKKVWDAGKGAELYGGYGGAFDDKKNETRQLAVLANGSVQPVFLPEIITGFEKRGYRHMSLVRIRGAIAQRGIENMRTPPYRPE